MSKANTKNHHLEAFDVLIGKWKTAGIHPAFPGLILNGMTSFEWIEGGAFVMMRTHIDHKDFPDGIAIFSSDDTQDEFMMAYFDERNVSRKYTCTLKNRIWKWWRDDEEFSQRFTCQIEDSGNRVVGKGEMSRKGAAWEKDLELTYSRM